MRNTWPVARAFLTWRTVLFLPVILGGVLLSYRSGYEFTRGIYPWANFDGVRYLDIARRGYITEAAFFPLYPLLIRSLAYVFGYFLSGFLISNVSFFLALVFLYKLVKIDYKQGTARESIIYLLVFPTAFFFGCLYSEGLFLFLLVASFYFARRGRWFLASIIAALLALTRPVGILILPALVWEGFEQLKTKNLRLKNFLCLAVIPAGLLAYVWFNLKKWGDALYFIKAHGELANSRSVNRIILFPQTVYRYLKILFNLPPSQYEWSIAFIELLAFSFVLLLLYCTWRKKVRASYLIFSVLAFSVPVFSGTFSGLPRYAAVIFPLFIALALSKSRLLKIFYIVVGAILQFLLLMFFSRGYFVS